MSIFVADIIRENDPEIEVIVMGENPIDDCDPNVEHYFRGALKDIPEDFRQCEVLRTGWLFGAGCCSISIPYRIIGGKENG